MDGISVLTILMLALVTENATFTFLYGSIFTPLRTILSKIKFFQEMFSCFLCTSFWMAAFFGLMAVYCSFAKYVFVLMLVHGGSRYINAIYTYIITGTKTTVPLRKHVDFED